MSSNYLISNNFHYQYDENLLNKNIYSIRYKYPIYKYIGTKISICKTELIFNYICKNISCGNLKLPWDHFELDNLIKNELQTKLNIVIDKISLNYKINNLDNYMKIYILKSFFIKVINNNEFIKYFEYTIPFLFDEFINFHPKRDNIVNMDAINAFEYNLLNSIHIMHSDDYSDLIIFGKKFIVILNSEYKLSVSDTNEFFFINKDYFYLKQHNLNLKIKIKTNYLDSKLVLYGFIKTLNSKELINISCDNNFNIVKYFDFINYETKLKIKSKTITKPSGEYCSQYIKNGCEIYENYNPTTDILNIISQCTLTDEQTGLRYRGTYSSTTENGKKINKTIKYNDEIKYQKEGDQVLVNTLENNTVNNDEFIIGWKIAKSESGEFRIIKLGILPDAIKIKPIDHEYFISHGKERCNKAIVMDIQLPDREKEISVVPEETNAYSFVFKPFNQKFKYDVGSEVYPDSFSQDENIGCAPGIHYFKNRETVFKAFIDDN